MLQLGKTGKDRGGQIGREMGEEGTEVGEGGAEAGDIGIGEGGHGDDLLERYKFRYNFLFQM